MKRDYGERRVGYNRQRTSIIRDACDVNDMLPPLYYEGEQRYSSANERRSDKSDDLENASSEPFLPLHS